MWIPMEANILEQRSRSDAILRAKIHRTRELFRYFSEAPKEAEKQRGRELFDAVRFKRQEEVEQAVAAEAALLEERDWLGRTPLHWGVMTGDATIVQGLLQAGAAVGAVDGDGWTPLHVAAFAGDAGLAQLLLEAGANPKLLDKRKLTPMQWAIAKGHREVAALLGAPR
jgi:ankyrin repeat protein